MQPLVVTGLRFQMTGWVCDFQPQEAHSSSRRLTSRIKQVISAIQWIGSPFRLLSGSPQQPQVLFAFRSTHSGCQTVQRPCGGATPRQPRSYIVAIRRDHYRTPSVKYVG